MNITVKYKAFLFQKEQQAEGIMKRFKGQKVGRCFEDNHNYLTYSFDNEAQAEGARGKFLMAGFEVVDE